MVNVTLRFPLGTYFTSSQRADDPTPGPEWPPSPARLVGALLAAAHEVPDDVDADRAVLQRLCDAPSPLIDAPEAVPWADDSGEQVAALEGTVRWAPRNPDVSELKNGLSPRVVARGSTEVAKGGVAIGDRPVRMVWPDLSLTPPDLARLRRMAADVAWLGTSRSPVVLTVRDDENMDESALVWRPLPWATVKPQHQVRVPTDDLLARFDAAFATRTSNRDRVESSGLMAPANGGRWWPYATGTEDRDAPLDPRHWGEMTIVALDDDSDLRPRTPATYLVARAFRAALLQTFAERGEEGDAPSVLHGHDAPHAAIVPLPFVGSLHADGIVRGVAVLYPHAERLVDLEQQRHVVDQHVAGLLGEPITLPGAGDVVPRRPSPGRNRLATLAPGRYTGPARCWVTVTPVVHSRWRKRGDLLEQVTRDCEHVGLPAPVSVEVLRAPAVAGGAGRLLAARELPETWRRTIDGPSSHLRVTFERSMHGPILLGRARHFGVGLLVPDATADGDDA